MHEHNATHGNWACHFPALCACFRRLEISLWPAYRCKILFLLPQKLKSYHISYGSMLTLMFMSAPFWWHGYMMILTKRKTKISHMQRTFSCLNRNIKRFKFSYYYIQIFYRYPSDNLVLFNLTKKMRANSFFMIKVN